jgi:hypothetical protein
VTEYHKIQTVFKRDPATSMRTLLEGEWSLPELGYLSDNEWEFTEKVDGTNIRIGLDGGGCRLIAGRTDAAQIHAQLLPALERPTAAEIRAVFPLKEDRPPFDVVLYGEGYGARIQKGGGNYRKDQGFVLFDVWVSMWSDNPGNQASGLWLQRDDVEDVARKLGLEAVPVVGYGNLHEMVRFVRDGFTSRWGNFPAEGLVARPRTELRSRAGHRLITKLKARDFPRT